MHNVRNGLAFNPLGDLVNVAGGPIAILFGLSVTSNVLMLTGSVFMLQVYDRVLPSRSMPTLVALTAIAVALYGFYALIEWVRARMAARLGGLIHERLAIALFRAAIKQKLSSRLGLAADPIRDLDSLRQFASGMGPISLLDLPWMPIYLVLAFMLHPLLGLMATLGAVVICALLVVNELHSRKPAMATTVAASERSAHTDDARTNAESIIAMGMLGAISARWQQSAERLVATQQRSADRSAFYTSATKGFRYLLQSAVLAVGAYLVIQGQLTGGLMIACSILTSRALAPVEQVVAHWRGFTGARQATTRIRQALEFAAVAPPKTDLPLPVNNVSVNNLVTGPDIRLPAVAAGVDFNLVAGDGMGIIGLSGSGKSSVARALVGVWPILAGEVRLDGSERSHYDPERLGQTFGYLPQAVELFDGTIAENISHFQPEPDVNAVLRAANAARVHELITSLPDGYDTRIGERGSILSAGQRQRIGLARALFGDPFLIVLDEPNSNLDAEGDAALTEALMDARKRGAIVIVIAHRPSAVASVNKLLFMREGRQVLFGAKETVLRQITQPPTVDERRKNDHENRGLERPAAE
ncbi:MAG TPA: type I secretion system permease/ATPase [Devosiaceae bacterium]|nr:type I secretion system permease/ATPase [Devosiaceae bacterium]